MQTELCEREVSFNQPICHHCKQLIQECAHLNKDQPHAKAFMCRVVSVHLSASLSPHSCAVIGCGAFAGYLQLCGRSAREFHGDSCILLPNEQRLVTGPAVLSLESSWLLQDTKNGLWVGSALIERKLGKLAAALRQSFPQGLMPGVLQHVVTENSTPAAHPMGEETFHPGGFRSEHRCLSCGCRCITHRLVTPESHHTHECVTSVLRNGLNGIPCVRKPTE